MPLRLLPPRALGRIDPAQGRDEPGLQPLALLVEQLAGLVDVKILDELAERPLEQEQRRDKAERQDASPDQPTHVRTPGHVPGSVSGRLILGSPPAGTQVTVFADLFTGCQRTVRIEDPMARPRKDRSARTKKPCKFGAHMSIAGGCDRAVPAAHAVGFQTVQLFTKNNNQWNAPPLLPEHMPRPFARRSSETGIVDPVAHTSYLINLASPDEALWKKSIDAMIVEVERCQQLGIADLVVHPGAHMGEGEEAGLRRVAAALDEVLRRSAGLRVTIDLETTAGQGTSPGPSVRASPGDPGTRGRARAAGRLRGYLPYFRGGLFPGRAGRSTMKRSGNWTGRWALDRLRVWHLNDSCRECGSRVDRHAGIGAGKMGLEPFRHLVNDPRFRHLPMILETPKGIEDGEDLDVRNLRTLRQLVAP